MGERFKSITCTRGGPCAGEGDDNSCIFRPIKLTKIAALLGSEHDFFCALAAVFCVSGIIASWNFSYVKRKIDNRYCNSVKSYRGIELPRDIGL